MVIDAAGRHFPERVQRHVQRFGLIGAPVLPKQKVEGRRGGEFGRVAEAAIDRLIEGAEITHGAVQQFLTKGRC